MGEEEGEGDDDDDDDDEARPSVVFVSRSLTCGRLLCVDDISSRKWKRAESARKEEAGQGEVPTGCSAMGERATTIPALVLSSSCEALSLSLSLSHLSFVHLVEGAAWA
jgi:hypothetical protein